MIDVTAPGKKPFHMEARAEGAGATAKIVISALEDDPNVGAAPVPVAAAATPGVTPPAHDSKPVNSGSSPGSVQRIIGFGAVGLGVVGLGVGGVFTLKSKSESDDAEDICPDFPDGECSSDDVDDQELLVKKARASQLNSFVAFGLGGVGVITGAVLILTAPKGENKAARVTVVPEVGANQVGFNVSGSW
jgi:hypothetical protein